MSASGTKDPLGSRSQWEISRQLNRGRGLAHAHLVDANEHGALDILVVPQIAFDSLTQETGCGTCAISREDAEIDDAEVLAELLAELREEEKAEAIQNASETPAASNDCLTELADD